MIETEWNLLEILRNYSVNILRLKKQLHFRFRRNIQTMVEKGPPQILLACKANLRKWVNQWCRQILTPCNLFKKTQRLYEYLIKSQTRGGSARGPPVGLQPPQRLTIKEYFHLKPSFRPQCQNDVIPFWCSHVHHFSSSSVYVAFHIRNMRHNLNFFHKFEIVFI